MHCTAHSAHAHSSTTAALARLYIWFRDTYLYVCICNVLVVFLRCTLRNIIMSSYTHIHSYHVYRFTYGGGGGMVTYSDNNNNKKKATKEKREQFHYDVQLHQSHSSHTNCAQIEQPLVPFSHPHNHRPYTRIHRYPETSTSCASNVHCICWVHFLCEFVNVLCSALLYVRHDAANDVFEQIKKKLYPDKTNGEHIKKMLSFFCGSPSTSSRLLKCGYVCAGFFF